MMLMLLWLLKKNDETRALILNYVFFEINQILYFQKPSPLKFYLFNYIWQKLILLSLSEKFVL